MNASSSSSALNRGELVRNAVLFLNDPKVASSSLTSRIQFLESKGLSEVEIQQALQQAQSPSAAQPSYEPYRPAGPPPYARGYGTAMAPEPPRRDWRDLFIMAVISGGVVYGLSTLAKKYLLPHLQPPSTTSFQDTSASLTAGYDEAAKLLADLSEQTTKLQTSLDEDRERVTAVVNEVEDALKSVRDGEERWREEMRDIRGEVESVRELVPKMIEKHAQSQQAALTDLQAELRSLKTLLVSRQQASPAAVNGNGVASGSGGSNGVSTTTSAANALLAPRGGKGIPAWQLPASSSSPGGSGSSTPLSGSAVLGGSATDEVKSQPKEDGV
ncbi:hypothetical protein IAU60_005813 [Kwoniella sp. DSM 27419]